MLGKTMKAAILVEQNCPLVVDDVKLPDTLEYGQVLVKIIYAGICGSQLCEIDGHKGPDPFLPHLLGHEGTGEVIAVGPGVKTVQADDHVVLHWRKGSGIDSPTPRYEWQGKTLNAGWVTTFNEYAVISENRMTTIPKAFNLRAATPLGCALTTALGVVNNDAKLGIGESVAVFGAGGVGQAIIQGAAMTSAHPIIAIDLHEQKLQMARQLGATHTINATEADPVEAIREIVGAHGVDVAIENTGIPTVIEQAYTSTHKEGRTILVGVPKLNDKAQIYTLPLHFEKVLKGSHGGDTRPDRDIPRYLKLASAGKLDLDPLVTDCFQLEEINQAITKMREGKVLGRAVIAVGSPQTHRIQRTTAEEKPVAAEV